MYEPYHNPYKGRHTETIISYPLLTKEGRRRKGGGVDVEFKEVRKGKKNKLGLQVHRGPMPLERVAGEID